MKQSLILVLLTCSALFSFSQNLVPNPGFEINTGCPGSSCQFDLVASWFNPSGLTSGCGNANFGNPDYFNTCGTGFFGTPSTLNGSVNPASGNGMVGLATYLSFSSNFREYIAVQLSSPLLSGRTYRVQLVYTNGLPDPNTSYGGEGTQLGIHLTSGPLSQNGRRPIRLTPTFETATAIFSTSWDTLSFLVTPNTTLDHVTIGNFNNDNNTLVQRFGTPSSTFSYAFYYIDDVLVEEVNPLEIRKPDTVLAPAIFTEEPYIYPNPLHRHTALTIRNASGYDRATLMDWSGKIVREIYGEAGQRIQFQTDGLAEGTYFVRLEDGVRNKILKLIIR